jgi:3-deoxy-7-phosphoheptulonate synthase
VAIPAAPVADASSVWPDRIEVGSWTIGGPAWTIIAGPCAVESASQVLEVAVGLRALGAHALRGGAFKPRTRPGSFAGLGREALPMLAEAKRATGLPVVTEVMDSADLESIGAVADCLQIGARNMQNFSLLHAVGQTRLPVLLKRGFGCTVDELLAAAEHIQSRGNDKVILCERGIRTFEHNSRFTLDVAAIAWLKARCPLPVMVDPSHAAGLRPLVMPLALAGLAAGADGLMVEVHEHPEDAQSDADQALTLDDFRTLMAKLAALAPALGRRLDAPVAEGP